MTIRAFHYADRAFSIGVVTPYLGHITSVMVRDGRREPHRSPDNIRWVRVRVADLSAEELPVYRAVIAARKAGEAHEVAPVKPKIRRRKRK